MACASDRTNGFLPYPAARVPSADTGMLRGRRLAVKDLFDVAGYPTGAGNGVVLAASGVKDGTAPIVQAVLDAGAEFVGKTHTDELAYSLIGRNRHFGAPINPRWPERIAGGSSSGSAVAVAAGLADIGLGTDTSGSIRLPAAANGLHGWRPTHGMFSLDGCRPLAPSFDTAGFLTRSLHEVAELMDVFTVAGIDRADVGYLIAEDILGLCDQPVAERFLQVLASGKRSCRTTATAFGVDLGEAAAAFGTILGREAFVSNQQLLAQAPQSIDPAIVLRLERGQRLGMREVAEARAIRDQIRSNLDAVLSGTRVLALPTIPTPPPGIGADESEFDRFRTRSISLLCIAGLSGCPQIAVPYFGKDGAYLSISYIAAAGSDRRALHAAAQIQRPDV